MSAAAQARLISSKVIVIGPSKHGAVAALDLAGAGVGLIGLANSARTTLSLMRQESLYNCQKTRFGKEDRSALPFAQVNPDTQILEHNKQFTAHNAEEIIERYDLVVDSLDDWQEKLLAGDTCVRLGKPFVHAAVTGFNFHFFTMLPGKSACLRCVFAKVGIEDFLELSKQNAFFTPVACMAGALQASEAIKILAHVGVTQADEFIHFDGLRREFHTQQGFRPSPDCPDCGRYKARS